MALRPLCDVPEDILNYYGRYSHDPKKTVEVMLEVGHTAVPKAKVGDDGFTHDWRIFVRGVSGARIDNFVSKVVFYLHESFPTPKRAKKMPPYLVAESGYAGFIVHIDVYFRYRREPKVHFTYNLFLRRFQPVTNIKVEIVPFENPSIEFKKKLLSSEMIYIHQQLNTQETVLETVNRLIQVHFPKVDKLKLKKEEVTPTVGHFQRNYTFEMPKPKEPRKFDIKDEDIVIGGPGGPFICGECEDAYPTEDSLNVHVRRAHALAYIRSVSYRRKNGRCGDN